MDSRTRALRPEAALRMAAQLRDARQRTLELTADLDAEQLLGPRLEIVNPPLWELGHVAWFQERWTLRELAGRDPVPAGDVADTDSLYDSTPVLHDTRWSLPLQGRAGTEAYMRRVLDLVFERLGTRGLGPDAEYYHRLALLHEDMHGEAFAYTRQTLGYPRPELTVADAVDPDQVGGGPLPGDVELAGGELFLGSTQDGAFVFDSEKWAHPVRVEPFAIARAPVTQAEFAEFVEAGGYERDEHWCDSGRAWRDEVGARQPVYWERATGGGWTRRAFDRAVPLEEHRPMHHVSWYEAGAWCRWAGRRLPTEAEWELAAGGAGRRLPWGNAAPTPGQAHLDARSLDCLDVGALPAGDTEAGCRQMIGNVWEWTASTFEPFPGFVADPYRDYSAPWFGTRKVLRGGAAATRSRLVRTKVRNFFTPDRRDVYAGFRTCAV